ncbi:MAG: histidine phosphatase family protein [Planctomycetota bacterium]|nr:MAG: histidine phosphatase family protein [Planctomycetota bacterium]
MRVFLVRHGAVALPRPGVFYGGTEVPLSPTGRAEAEAAAELLAETQPTALWSSPLERARSGAERIAARHPGLEVRIDPGLREIDRGRWTGLRPEEIERRWPGQLAAHRADPESWRGHGGESLGDLRRRALAAWRRILERSGPGDLIVVSHLHPTRAILAEAAGLPLAAWPDLQLPTGSVSLLEGPPEALRPIWIGRTKPAGRPV